MIPWWAVSFGEADIARVTAAILARHISQGPVTRAFEERLAERLGVPYVVCTSSGTTALTMALLAAGLKAGDEVIIPDRTWIATAHAVMIFGGLPILVDVDEASNLFFADALDKISARTQVIMPVNLNGRLGACLPTKRVPFFIEDSCQAFPAPPRGLAACYSMSTAKLLPTGQGGFVAIRDEGFYRELKALRTHDVEDAMRPQVLQWRRFGYNFRYTDIQASIGLAQLESLDERIARLREIRRQYEAGLPAWAELLPTDGVPLYTEILHPEPERLRAHLLSAGIEARPFYPPLHTAPYLKPPHRTGYCDYEFPNAMKFSSGLFLPSGPAQSDENIQRTLAALHDFR